jgi:hypothetical protein
MTTNQWVEESGLEAGWEQVGRLGEGEQVGKGTNGFRGFGFQGFRGF